MVSLQAKLLSGDRLRRYQRETYRNLQEKIFDLWDLFNGHKITTKKLLQKVSKIYAPCD
jgi:hypothetical protein